MSASAQDVRLGLVAYWPFDALSPDELTTPDLAPFGSDLTLEGMGASNLVEGHRGNALEFDGFSSILFRDTGDGANPGLPLQNNPQKTICMWVKADGTVQQDRRVFSEASMDSNAPMFNMGTDNAATNRTGKLDIYIRGDDNAAPVDHAKSNSEPFDGTWRHLALTENNGVLNYYVDGVLDTAVRSYTRPTMTLNTLSIGGIKRLSGSLTLFTGVVDDVAVWNRVLSAAEIQQVMAEGLAMPVPPLITANREGPFLQGDKIRLTADGSAATATTFQWKRNGEDIPGATDRTYTIAALTEATQGEYTVVADGGTSSPALNLAFIADPAPDLTTNIVSWWPMETFNDGELGPSTPDPWGGHPLLGVNMEIADLVPGKIGKALQFDGFSKIAHRTTGFPVTSQPEYSVAFWVKADGMMQSDMRVFAEGSDASNTPLFAMGTATDGTSRLRMYVRSDANVVAVDRYSESTVLDDSWRHVVWTDRNGQARLYVDGEMDATNFSYNRAPLTFTLNQTSVGGIQRLIASHWTVSTMDEVALWNRALTWSEVQALVATGVPAPVAAVAPAITTQPVSRTVWEGRPVRLSVEATGTAPFDIQWMRNGSPVTGGTEPVLVIDPSAAADSGEYTVSFTNSAGTATSAAATVLVRPIENLDTGRLSLWPFDGGDATTPDSLAGHHFTLNNLDLQTAFQPGVNGNAVYTDGLDDILIHTRTGTGTDIPLTTRDEYTIAFWVRGTGFGQSDRRVFAEGSTTNTNPLFNLGTDSTGSGDLLNFYIRGDGGANPVNHQTSFVPVFDGEWHYVIYTDFNGQGQLYVDGIEDVQLSYTRPISTFHTLSVGGISRANPSHWFAGAVDELTTWERALSPEEAAQLFALQPQPETIFAITSFQQIAENQLQLKVATSYSLESHIVQSTTNPATGGWVNAPDAVLGTLTNGILTIDIFPTLTGRQFYRVVVP